MKNTPLSQATDAQLDWLHCMHQNSLEDNPEDGSLDYYGSQLRTIFWREHHHGSADLAQAYRHQASEQERTSMREGNWPLLPKGAAMIAVPEYLGERPAKLQKQPVVFMDANATPLAWERDKEGAEAAHA